MDKDIEKYYATGFEKERLELETFKLEGIRTKQILERYLSPKPLKILDVGGATGFYSFWLKTKGHEVTLVDLSPDNIRFAKEHAAEKSIQLDGYEVGNATSLSFPDNTFDLVLLMGPLYHLVNRDDRVRSLSEARRVLKPGGLVFGVMISRYASLVDGLLYDQIGDPEFLKILKQDLETGVHINHTDNQNYFTTANFHTPSEIEDEVKASGLQLQKLIAVESVGWIIKNFLEKSGDPVYLKEILNIIESVELNRDIIAISPHIMAVAMK